MIYYVSDNKLYCSEVPVSHSDFVEVTRQEYYSRLSKAVSNRESGTPISENDLNEE